MDLPQLWYEPCCSEQLPNPIRCVSCSGTEAYETGSVRHSTVFISLMPRFFKTSTMRGSFFMTSSVPKISLGTNGAWTSFLSFQETSLREVISTCASKVWPLCRITTSASRGTAFPGFQARTALFGGSRRRTLANRSSGPACPFFWRTSYTVQYSAVVKLSSGWRGAVLAIPEVRNRLAKVN